MSAPRQTYDGRDDDRMPMMHNGYFTTDPPLPPPTERCGRTTHDFRQYLYPDATDRGHPVPVLLFCAKCGDWREWTGWKAREDYR